MSDGDRAMILIPAYVEAMQDRALRGNPREVYTWCHEHLDLVEFRFVKHGTIERALSLRDSSVSDSMNRLVQRGYLARGLRDGRVTSYRLFYSRSTPETPSASAIPAQTGILVEHSLKR